jgi:hypothetical protein
MLNTLDRTIEKHLIKVIEDIKADIRQSKWISPKGPIRELRTAYPLRTLQAFFPAFPPSHAGITQNFPGQV